MNYCSSCGKKVPENVLFCDCQQGFTAFIGRVGGHFYFRSNAGFWHESALFDLVLMPLFMLLLVLIFLLLI
tara:strand:+ start:211 stop:423 length:213 start_codon:yes stop_codon:yes gene_type:complete